jgi:hypothetical protein
MMSGIWYGVAMQEGATLGISGKDTAEGWAISADDHANRFWFNLDSWRVGAGLGASVAAALVIITSLGDPRDLDGFAVSDWDYQLSMGAKWNSVAKWLGSFHKYGSVAKLGIRACKRVMSLEEWEKTHEKIRLAVSALRMNVDGKVPEVNILAIPGFGGGLEISAYKWAGEFRIQSVELSTRH